MNDPLESLLVRLRELDAKLRQVMRVRWQRDLPMEELVFDRWQRAKSLGFGEGSSVYHNSYIYGDVKVGKDTWIGPFTLLEGVAGIQIGDHCSISAGVHIYTHDTVKWALSGGKAEADRAPVIIGDCCYIGSQTVISKGVTIGHHVVVSACSFVNRDLPDYSIAAGVPCKIIGKVVMNDNDFQLIYG